MAKGKEPGGCIEPGFWVAVTVREGAAPLRSYVGQVQVADERGVRLTLVDWLTGTASGYDLFLPWDTIEAALVSTLDHDPGEFGEKAKQWQTRVLEQSDAPAAPNGHRPVTLKSLNDL